LDGNVIRIGDQDASMKIKRWLLATLVSTPELQPLAEMFPKALYFRPKAAESRRVKECTCDEGGACLSPYNSASLCYAVTVGVLRSRGVEAARGRGDKKFFVLKRDGDEVKGCSSRR
jgi:hypothetical protein